MNKKVTGIGGIFFKCDNPKNIREWYSKHLGFDIDDHGTMFKSRKNENRDLVTYLQWSPFESKTDYFNPSNKDFMINYRVENIVELVEELRESGVTVLDEIKSYDYGIFVHILDPENNKIELWEPVDEVFTEMEDGKTSK